MNEGLLDLIQKKNARIKELEEKIVSLDGGLKASCLEWAEDDTAIKEICAEFGIMEDWDDGFKPAVECVKELATKCRYYKSRADYWQDECAKEIKRHDPMADVEDHGEWYG